MEVGGGKVLLDIGGHQLGWVIASENPSVNARLRQGLGFIIFLGTKAFNFKFAYSSFWRNKNSMKLTKRFNSQHLIIPQSYVGRDFVLKNFNSHRYVIVQATFKKALFLSHNRFSFILCGFSTDYPQEENPAYSLFSSQCCGHGVLSIAGNFFCIWVFLTFSSLKSSFQWHSLFKKI